MGTPVNCQVLDTELFKLELSQFLEKTGQFVRDCFIPKPYVLKTVQRRFVLLFTELFKLVCRDRTAGGCDHPPPGPAGGRGRVGGRVGWRPGGRDSVGGRGDRRDGPLRDAAAGALGGRSLRSLCLRWPRLRPSLVCYVSLNGIKPFDRSPYGGFPVSGNVPLAGWVGGRDEPIDAAGRLFDADELGPLDDSMN